MPAEIDVDNADGVCAGLRAAVAPGVTIVVADMTATTFCDTRGIGALVLAHQHAAASGAELRLVVPSTGVLRVLDVLGLDAVLAIYRSLPAAGLLGAHEQCLADRGVAWSVARPADSSSVGTRPWGAAHNVPQRGMRGG